MHFIFQFLYLRSTRKQQISFLISKLVSNTILKLKASQCGIMVWLHILADSDWLNKQSTLSDKDGSFCSLFGLFHFYRHDAEGPSNSH